MAKLTPKQSLFVAEYLVSFNATQAAVKAGYSEQTARVIGPENLSKPVVAKAIQEAMEERSQRLKIDADEVLRRLSLLCAFNIRKFVVVTDGVARFDFTHATEDDWYCVSEYSVDVLTKGAGDDRYDVERVRLKFADKLRALELVGKHKDVQAYKETMGVNLQVNIAERIFAARRRINAEQDEMQLLEDQQ